MKKTKLALVVLLLWPLLLPAFQQQEDQDLMKFHVYHVFVIRLHSRDTAGKNARTDIRAGIKPAIHIPLSVVEGLKLEGSFFLNAFHGNPGGKRIRDEQFSQQILPPDPQAGTEWKGRFWVSPEDLVYGSRNRLMTTHDFPLDSLGTWNTPSIWEEQVKIRSQRIECDTTATARIVAFKGDDLIGGYLESFGQACIVNRFSEGAVQTYSFSHAALRIKGGEELSDVEIEWRPEILASTQGETIGRAYDPISVQVVDEKGAVVRRQTLLEIQVSIKGDRGSFEWRKDGEVEARAVEMSLRVNIPGVMTRDRGEFEIRALDGKVSRQLSNGLLKTIKLIRPRPGRFAAADKKAGAAPVPPAFTAKIPNFTIRCALPKLEKGQSYILQLGGGGDIGR